jgi:hypothetical protein
VGHLSAASAAGELHTVEAALARLWIKRMRTLAADRKDDSRERRPGPVTRLSNILAALQGGAFTGDGVTPCRAALERKMKQKFDPISGGREAERVSEVMVKSVMLKAAGTAASTVDLRELPQ